MPRKKIKPEKKPPVVDQAKIDAEIAEAIVAFAEGMSVPIDSPIRGGRVIPAPSLDKQEGGGENDS